MKYFLAPLGCQMNKSDAERIRTVLDKAGLVETDHEEEASLLGLVACSVRQKSINRVYGRIEKWNQWKRKKNVITFVSGCILPADEGNFLKLFDLVFKIDDLPRLPRMIRQYGIVTPFSQAPESDLEGNEEASQEFWKIKPKYSSVFQAYVPIQNGCNKFCSFCAVPYTRGREVSRPSSEILAEVSDLLENGCKTITLLGQNVNSYGMDREEEMSFARLLQEIGELGKRSRKEFWLYYTSPHPSDMTREVFEVMAIYPCLARHLHLPIQSGDDTILKRMNRSYSMERFRHIVRDVREVLPEATLFTDIIVGFSGETREQFQHTLDALREFQFDMAYIAQYSPRPGAASYEWPDDVPTEEKKKRYEELTQELRKVGLLCNQRRMGKVCRALVEGMDRKAGYLAARTEGLIPCRFACTDTSRVGQFVDIRITSVTSFALEGEMISDVPQSSQ